MKALLNGAVARLAWHFETLSRWLVYSPAARTVSALERGEIRCRRNYEGAADDPIVERAEVSAVARNPVGGAACICAGQNRPILIRQPDIIRDAGGILNGWGHLNGRRKAIEPSDRGGVGKRKVAAGLLDGVITRRLIGRSKPTMTALGLPLKPTVHPRRETSSGLANSGL